ncbi:S41 family peptidase [Aquimarina brevivitae]|uniref:Peptidase S41-like protein n=1 Tax=Aquimarina brevivitae TaxID=323412 RepID=A0A4V2F5P7_9FLAO|nr:S41 family peptidase [Aquimarina brevivitae]RZS93559.1 peptidase S41-like protein [Aquimarina brevivitae]
MNKTFSLLLLVIITLNSFGQQKFPKQGVLEDLLYLKTSLEKAHYNLYTYITEEAFNENYTKVRTSITQDSLTILETTSLLQAVISKANNGHTEIPFPGATYGAYANAGGTLFPLELAFENGKALIRKNLSTNDSLQIGSEVITINKRSINDILYQIYPLISAERRYFKLAKLELFSFPRYYWQAFGEQKFFDVEVKENGIVKKYKLDAVDAIKGFEIKRNEIFQLDREFGFIEGAAYLRPGNFSGDKEQYKRFIDSSFTAFKTKKSPNLIIDLRNNLGGDDSFSDYLVSYIAHKPFRWCSKFTLKTSAILKRHVKETYDVSQPFWKSVLSHDNGSIYKYEFDLYQPQPETKRYQGKVYVLVNRQSHSQSAVTAAQIQDYSFATIVGEETGDFPSLLASQYGFNLPNTGINVKIAKGYIVRINGSKKPEGVQPDIIIKDHLLDENDEILDGLLAILKNQQ